MEHICAYLVGSVQTPPTIYKNHPKIIMKKSSKLVFTLGGLLLAGVALMSAAGAAEPSPSDRPPQLDPQEEGDQAVTTSKNKQANQTQQLIQNGQQTEVRVTSGVGTYIVKPNQNVGTSLPGDAQSNSNNPVQWVVKSWGGKKDTAPANDAPPVLQPNPNPPARQ